MTDTATESSRPVPRSALQSEELRHAYERIRFKAELLAAVDQAVIATDLEGRIRYWNRGAEKLYGWLAEDVTDRSIMEVTPAPELGEQAAEIMAQVARGESWEGKFTVKRRDGSRFLARITDSPIRDAQGNIIGVVGISYDCSNEETLAAEQRAAREAAERAAQDREQVLAIVSHDLRNPLNVVLSAASLLLETELQPDQRVAQLRLIRSAADRMHHLIGDLLDAASIRKGGLRVVPVEASADRIVDQAVSAIRSLADAQRITLDTAGVPDGLVVHADPGRIVQVLDNLLSNALRFATPGQSVRISARRAGDQVCFSVADDGPGIPSAERAHVFEGFWRGGDTERAGTGLGLSICRGIVEAHGGAIWLDTDTVVGTTVHFTVPAVG